LHVELKDRFRSASALLCQPPPVGVAPPRSAIASQAIAHGIDTGVILVGWPMAMEIVEGTRPAAQKPVLHVLVG